MAEIVSTPPADCRLCPRLVRLRRDVRAKYPDYHAAPVPAWGSARARLLIVGLAPGMHGANRTGRPFTGDASGEFLFGALERAGLAFSRNGQIRLAGSRITNAVKCLPPGNRPTGDEIRRCGRFLAAEIEVLRGVRPRRNRCVLCLGGLAHQAVAAVLPEKIDRFQHGAIHTAGGRLYLVDTYHPSRLNTNTGRLTEPMLDRVLDDVRGLLAG